MILEALARPKLRRPLLQVLRAQSHRADGGTVGEDRLVLGGVSWKGYLKLDRAFGHQRAEPRLYYLDGELEIMTTSLQHERLKEWLGALVEDYLLESDVEAFPHGQATLKVLQEVGAEPDKSWCLHQDKDHPDLVVEIALTSGGIDKLDVYRRLAVPEVWLWRKGGLEVWILRRDGSAYEGPSRKSWLLPGLDLEAMTRCLGLGSWRAARRSFRQTLRKPRR